MLKHCVVADFLLIEGYVQGALRKELHIAPFLERFKKNYRKVLLINFVRIWHNLLSHCIFAKFQLMEGYVMGALRKELRIAFFVQRFKTTTFGMFH